MKKTVNCILPMENKAQASPPSTPPTQPAKPPIQSVQSPKMVAVSSFKPKMSKYFSILLGLILLGLIGGGTYYYFFVVRKKALIPSEQPALPLLSFGQLKDDLLSLKAEYAIVVNGEPITWEEVEEAIRYDTEIWEIRGDDSSEEKGILVDRLVERKLIGQIAQKEGIANPTQEELEKAKTDLFGEDFNFERVSYYPEFQAQVETKALRDKIERSTIKSYSGALIYVKFLSIGGKNMKWADPKVEAKKKVEELRDQARSGMGLSELVALANNDPEVMELNDEAKMEEFENAQIEDLELPAPEFKETVKSLLPGQLSKIITLTAIMRPDLGTYEEFGFGFVKLGGASGGELESFEALFNQTKEKAIIEVNI